MLAIGVQRTVILLGLAVAMPASAWADPDCGTPRHRSPDCPRSMYSPLHYWAPTWYRLRATVHPSSLDQYPPGPFPTVPAPVEITRHKCRAIPPGPGTPYADPAGYFGRPIAPLVEPRMRP